MPIRYYVDLNCPPRENIGSEELLALLARWERATTVRQQFRDQYNLGDESKMRFRETVNTPEGTREKRETTVAQLREECAVLGQWDSHCARCPASLNGQPYGCTQSVSLPLSHTGELWLVDQLPPAGSRALELFFDAASASGYGESPILDGWRRAGFLEAREPEKAERAGLLVTSGQVVQELFLVGDLMPPHVLGVLLHLQALRASDGREGDDLLALLENVDAQQSAENAPTIEFALTTNEDDEASVRELKQFLYAAYVAFSLQTPLAIRI